MTAGRLGKIVGVSESTVVRFASELGYDGYPCMRKALQEMIRNRLTSVQRIEVAKDMIDDTDIVRSVINSDIQNLQATLELLEEKSFNNCIDSIIEAKNVYIVGMPPPGLLRCPRGYRPTGGGCRTRLSRSVVCCEAGVSSAHRSG